LKQLRSHPLSLLALSSSSFSRLQRPIRTNTDTRKEIDIGLGIEGDLVKELVGEGSDVDAEGEDDDDEEEEGRVSNIGFEYIPF
jgi:hypothetical protein